MGIINSMHSSVAGLKSFGGALSVVADNIANASTNGFKSSRVEFQDLLSRGLKGIYGGNQIGQGSKLGAVTAILSQGNVDRTERMTDIALNGKGYFVVKGFDGISYTRNGEFQFDKDGYLVTSDKARVQGFEATANGKIGGKLTDIRLPSSLVSARPTRVVRFDVNLDSRVAEGKEFDITRPYDSTDFTTGVEIHDSQGTKHLITVAFNKVDDGVWEYRGLADGGEVKGGRPGTYSQVIKGRLTFNPEGLLTTEEILEKNFNFTNGAQPNQDVVFDFGDSLVTDKGKGLNASHQYGANSDLVSWSQDGASAGQLTGLSFDDEGVLSAMYSNGELRDRYQLGVATFQNPEGLFKAGDNKLKESRESGNPSVGSPNQSGRGQVFSKSVEKSNVDIAREFVDMIQYQRNFQANAKGITTADEMLSEVINIKR